MSLFEHPSFLRRVLLADAAASTATGALMLFGASMLEPLLGLPVSLMQIAGASLLPFAALVAFIATRERISGRAVWLVIIVNAVWTVDSIALLLTGWVQPTLLGNAFVIGQALAVGVLAELQYFGLRRARMATA
ncbi:hypothetical protein [Noviherbaspirillum sp.]|uniref:hypothetical protein n=1 Tax=Noviherbaspirillum sp. TaxID=1926288 RepID=UPI002FE18D75